MNVTPCKLQDCLLIEPKRFDDERGFFQEQFREVNYRALGIKEPLVQDNWSRSNKGVLRGMHFQKNQPQGKLISVVRGEIFDVVVDIRKESPTFSKWQTIVLSEFNSTQLWVPPGFAHGFLVLSDVADVIYKTSQYYQAKDEGCIRWDDKTLNIDWPINPLFISEKDKNALSFEQVLL